MAARLVFGTGEVGAFGDGGEGAGEGQGGVGVGEAEGLEAGPIGFGPTAAKVLAVFGALADGFDEVFEEGVEPLAEWGELGVDVVGGGDGGGGAVAEGAGRGFGQGVVEAGSVDDGVEVGGVGDGRAGGVGEGGMGACEGDDGGGSAPLGVSRCGRAGSSWASEAWARAGRLARAWARARASLP